MGRPHSPWLQQVDQHVMEMGMGQASAWGLGLASWSTGGKWTQRHAAPAHAPIPDLTLRHIVDLWIKQRELRSFHMLPSDFMTLS